MMNVRRIVRLDERDSGVTRGIVRVHNSWIDADKSDPTRFYRRDAVMVVSSETDARTLRFVMGAAGGIKGLIRDAIAVDYDAFDALGVPYQHNGAVNLTIRRATVFEVYRYFWSHPDMGYRTATQLGLLGALLGLSGLIVALLASGGC